MWPTAWRPWSRGSATRASRRRGRRRASRRRAVRTLLADFSSLRAAGEAVSAIIGAGLVPAALEMMDRSCIQAVEDSVYAAGYPRDAAAVLLVELDGRSEAAVDEEARQAASLLTAQGARHVRQAADAKQRERLGQGREKAVRAG